MKRLIQRGLMFGNLIRVDSPALIGRYNRALENLAGLRTSLEEFHIDISGYSPEIGDELSDDLYLNPNGVNRQFIILTTQQRRAPLLNAKFSTSRGILRQFIDDNEAKLFALTANDAVAGELMNSVYEVDTPARLFDIRQITVEADTTQSHVANARKLADKIDRFQKEEDAWFDDVLIGEMIGLAKKTGDVTRNPINLDRPQYTQGNFWTAHFGGLYVFRDVNDWEAVIYAGEKPDPDQVPIVQLLGFRERNTIAAFLDANGLVEPVIKARGVNGAAILRQKMDFILVDTATSRGMTLDDLTPRGLHRLAQRLGKDLPEEFKALGAMVRWAESGGPWPRIASDHPAYFYTLRARPDHPDRDLINQLLAELAPLDVRQLFICHKQAFYAAYAGWSDAKKEYVAEFLYRDYIAGKAGARDALFGGDETASENSPAAPTDEMINLVGPWGAVRGG